MISDPRIGLRPSLRHLGAWIGGFAAAFAIFVIVSVVASGGTVTVLDGTWLLLWWGPPAIVAAVALCVIELVLLWAMRQADGVPAAVKAVVPAVAIYCWGAAMMIGYVAASVWTPEEPELQLDSPVELAMYTDEWEQHQGSESYDPTGGYVGAAVLPLVPAGLVFVSHFFLARRHSASSRRREPLETDAERPLGR